MNFQERLSHTAAKQIIYLSGLSNEPELSAHLTSRKHVDAILRSGNVPVTTLMAGIIIGPQSASFHIIRDLVTRLPVMVTPRWVRSLTQPIAIGDVLDYLMDVLRSQDCINQSFEIGGPEILSYKQLLLEFGRIIGKKRFIFTLLLLTLKLSSYWLYFITQVPLSLASSLIDSLKNNAICKDHRIETLFPKRLKTFEEAVCSALPHCANSNSSSRL